MSSSSSSAAPTPPAAAPPPPPTVNYVVGFLLVGLAWGLTTPFIRRAARAHSPPPHPILESDTVRDGPWLKRRAYTAFFAVADLLRNPRYAVPLLLNLTGSVWFFLLIGQAGESCPLASNFSNLSLSPSRTEAGGRGCKLALVSPGDRCCLRCAR